MRSFCLCAGAFLSLAVLATASWAADPQPAGNAAPAAKNANVPRPAARKTKAAVPLPATFDAATVGKPGDEAAYRQITAALDSPTECDFTQTPLDKVVEYFKDKHKISIGLDIEALKDAGCEANKPVTYTIKGITLRAALRQILEQHLSATQALAIVIHNQMLLLTSQVRAESEEFLLTKVYPVEDLVSDPTAEDEPDFQPLIDMIINTVAPKTWQDPAGGPGTLKEFVSGSHDYLVASQCQEVHDLLGSLFVQLRKLDTRASGIPADKRKVTEATLVGTAGDDESYRRITAALDSPTQCDFVNVPPKKVIEYFATRHGIPIAFDSEALKDCLSQPSCTSVTFRSKGTTLRAALQQLLDNCLDATQPLKLAIHNQTLLVTSQSKAESEGSLIIKVYPIEDLLTENPTAGGEVDVQPLIDVITNSIAPKTWADPAGGPATMRDLFSGNRAYLVVSQTMDVHDDIAILFARIRKLNHRPAAEAVRPARPLRHAGWTSDNCGIPGGVGGFFSGMGGVSPAATPPSK